MWVKRQEVWMQSDAQIWISSVNIGTMLQATRPRPGWRGSTKEAAGVKGMASGVLTPCASYNGKVLKGSKY